MRQRVAQVYEVVESIGFELLFYFYLNIYNKLYFTRNSSLKQKH